MPFVSPVTVQLVAGTLKVQDLELSCTAVTVYEVGVPPVPLSVTLTVACPFPAVALGVFGVPGTGATIVRERVMVERTMMSPETLVSRSSAVRLTVLVPGLFGTVPLIRQLLPLTLTIKPLGRPVAVQFL